MQWSCLLQSLLEVKNDIDKLSLLQFHSFFGSWLTRTAGVLSHSNYLFGFCFSVKPHFGTGTLVIFQVEKSSVVPGCNSNVDEAQRLCSLK